MAASDKHARTEKPTQKRRKEARAEGRVARSPELGGWLAMLLATALAPRLLSMAYGRLVRVLTMAVGVISHPTTAGAVSMLEAGLKTVLVYVAIMGGAFMALGVLVGVAQAGRAVSLRAARPQFRRVSPKAGLQRLFAGRALWELAKQVAKLLVLVVLAFFSLHSLIDALGPTSPVSLRPALEYTGSSIVSFVRMVALVGLFIAGADLLYQRHRLSQSLKMTKQEVKDEHKAQEGDPTVKAQLRRRQRVIARSKMIGAVKTADVVVANPTHVCVALVYDPARGSAPRVVAKGVDVLALRIREVAATYNVPVIEDPPLARYLYAVCEIEEQVPPAVYVAVARLIAFVYTLAPATRGVGVHRRPHSVVPEVDPEGPPPGVTAAIRAREALVARRRARVSTGDGKP